VVNGEDRDVSAEQLDQVLIECGYENPAIATAVNGTFVHRHLREQTRLIEGDRVEVVAPIEGG
ncbi:MAG: sulfur carrier protein ThiS, partial [Granulosicoccus sp.]|nr:sulfur carrier protein ThiS [Granulosicoccus sp.]